MKLIKIEQAKPETCWDISVKKHSNFFAGGVLVHNSNAGIAFDLEDESLIAQKRSSYVKEGHFGFASFVSGHEDYLKNLMKDFCLKNGLDNVRFFGEWAGQGIQSNVGLSQFPKMFILFGVWTDDGTESGIYLNKSYFADIQNPSIRFYNVFQSTHWEIELDMADPNKALEKMQELTLEVERESPFCKKLGAEPNKDGLIIGEGIVWRCGDYFLKTKGNLHSKGGGAKTPTLDPIKAASINSFIDQTVTLDRLEQGWDLVEQEVGIIEKKHLGKLIPWIVKDIELEEFDALEANNLDITNVKGAIGKAAQQYYIKKIEKI